MLPQKWWINYAIPSAISWKFCDPMELDVSSTARTEWFWQTEGLVELQTLEGGGLVDAQFSGFGLWLQVPSADSGVWS